MTKALEILFLTQCILFGLVQCSPFQYEFYNDGQVSESDWLTESDSDSDGKRPSVSRARIHSLLRRQVALSTTEQPKDDAPKNLDAQSHIHLEETSITTIINTTGSNETQHSANGTEENPITFFFKKVFNIAEGSTTVKPLEEVVTHSPAKREVTSEVPSPTTVALNHSAFDHRIESHPELQEVITHNINRRSEQATTATPTTSNTLTIQAPKETVQNVEKQSETSTPIPTPEPSPETSSIQKIAPKVSEVHNQQKRCSNESSAETSTEQSGDAGDKKDTSSESKDDSSKKDVKKRSEPTSTPSSNLGQTTVAPQPATLPSILLTPQQVLPLHNVEKRSEEASTHKPETPIETSHQIEVSTTTTSSTHKVAKRSESTSALPPMVTSTPHSAPKADIHSIQKRSDQTTTAPTTSASSSVSPHNVQRRSDDSTPTPIENLPHHLCNCSESMHNLTVEACSSLHNHQAPVETTETHALNKRDVTTEVAHTAPTTLFGVTAKPQIATVELTKSESPAMQEIHKQIAEIQATPAILTQGV
jgi:hypothetical protein